MILVIQAWTESKDYLDNQMKITVWKLGPFNLFTDLFTVYILSLVELGLLPPLNMTILVVRRLSNEDS